MRGSARAYGVEAQVVYELRRKGGEGVVRRFYMLSNAIPAQPESVAESEEQFEEVCDHFNIEAALSNKDKLARLRQTPAQDLVDALEHLKHHTFRPVTDDLFIQPGIVEYLTSGSFAKDLQRRGMKLLIGEVLNEETFYAEYNAPTWPSLSSLHEQLSNYYAPTTVDRILPHYDLPQNDDLGEWKRLYGTIVCRWPSPRSFLVSGQESHRFRGSC